MVVPHTGLDLPHRPLKMSVQQLLYILPRNLLLSCTYVVVAYVYTESGAESTHQLAFD
jgi:hypothetical protein